MPILTPKQSGCKRSIITKPMLTKEVDADVNIELDAQESSIQPQVKKQYIRTLLKG